jgi:hypothetical protein
MSYFAHAFKKVFLGTGSVITAGSIVDLKGGQLALVDAKSYKALTASTAKKSAFKEVILAQGSFHSVDQISPFLGGLKEPVQSRIINGNYTTKFVVAHPRRPKNHVVTIGWDTVSDCKTISGKLDTEYRIRIDVKGSPALRAFNRNLYRTFMVKTRCGDDCSTDCNQPEDRHWIADQFVSLINSDTQLSLFIKADKVFNVDPIAGVDNVSYTVYQLTVCDTGDHAALAAVEGQYPGKSVVRVSRAGSSSTYQVTVPTADGAPAAFNTGVFRVVPNCLSCPAGYTLVNAGFKFIVMKEEAMPANIATAETTVKNAYGSAQAIFLGHESGVSSYSIIQPTNIQPAPASVAETIVPTGEALGAFCSLTSPTAVNWVSVGTKYKVTRTLCMTIAKDCVGTSAQIPSTTTTTSTTTTSTTTTSTTASPNSVLGQLIAFYSTDVSVVPGSVKLKTSGECADIFEIKQYNNEPLLDFCASEATPSFDTLQSFRGFEWKECGCGTVGTVDDTSLVGIRLTAAYEDTKFSTCSFKPEDHFELEPLEIIVSQVDIEGNVCELPLWPVTELQLPQSASGTGEQLLRDMILFQGYRQERFDCDPRMREILDYPHLNVIDRSKLYKHYYIFHNVPYLNRRTGLFDNEQYVLDVAFPEDVDSSAFEQLVGSYLASNNVFLESY